MFFQKNKEKEIVVSFKGLFYMDLGVLDAEQFEEVPLVYNVDHGEQSTVVD